MNIKEIIKRINYFRNRKNMSARALSDAIDKSENYINRLENVGINLPITVLLEIINALEISPEEFFSSNFRTYRNDNELYNLIKDMPEDKKQSLTNFIKHI